MKIGIFGGSFNPPHKMHKQIALELINNNYVNKVIFVPTGNKYKKKDLIEAKERLEMLKIMTRSYENLLTSDYEIKNVLTYTYQTLDYFKALYPSDEIYFICGTDNLRELPTWKNYEYILNNYKIIVIARNNDDVKEIVRSLKTTNIIISKITPQSISSTEIRNNLKEGNDDSNLDTKVKKYIIKRKLYC